MIGMGSVLYAFKDSANEIEQEFSNIEKKEEAIDKQIERLENKQMRQDLNSKEKIKLIEQIESLYRKKQKYINKRPIF